MKRTRISILLTVVFLLFNPISALAHTGLVESNPVSESQLSELPREISLTFDEELLVIQGKQANSIELLDENKTSIKLAEPVIAGAKITAQLLESSNEPHTYQVNYRVVSADGHPVNGTLTFTVQSQLTKTPEQPVNEEAKKTSTSSLNIIGAILIALTLIAGHFIYRRMRN